MENKKQRWSKSENVRLAPGLSGLNSQFFSNSASLFLISQFWRQGFVIKPVNAQETLVRAHIWPQLVCPIKMPSSSSLWGAGPVFRMWLLELQWPVALSTGGHSTRYVPPSRFPCWWAPCSKTHSSNMALPMICPSSHPCMGFCHMTPLKEEQCYMVSGPEICSHIHWSLRRLIGLLLTRHSLAMLPALHIPIGR